MTANHQRQQIVTVYGPEPGDLSLIPLDSLPEPGAEVSVTPWGDAVADDWCADHIRFSFGWGERHAGMGITDITAEACGIAARLLTEAGLTGPATLHLLPVVDFSFQYLVRPLSRHATAP